MDPLEQNLRTVESKLTKLQEKAQQEALFAENANQRFETNIKAFEKYFPEIYQRFISYTPQESFQLIVNDNGSANIIDYDTNVPMYSADPETQVVEQIKATVVDPKISQIDFSHIEHLKNETNFLHVDLMKKIGACYNKTKQKLAINKNIDNKIPSMVIFGVGLGYHLQPLIELTTAAYISIFEPNEDYFFASLFCFDWAKYLHQVDKDGSYLYISIGDSENEVYEKLYQRAQDIGAFSISNSLFFQHYPSKAVARLINEIKNNFHQFFMGWGFFDDALMSIAHTIGVVAKSPKFLKYPMPLTQQIKEYPVFIVANGPSLDQDIEKIKQESAHAIIVSCNSATTSLLANGIIPDFHVALERTKATGDFLKAFISEENRQKINLLVLNVMYPEVLDLFKWSGIALKGHEAGTILYQLAQHAHGLPITPTIGYSNPLVGNTGLSFFTHLGFKNIYLFGVDSGYIDKNHHHSKDSFYYDESGKTVYKPITMGDEFEVEGNFGGKVITEPFLFSGKQQMERLLATFKDSGLTCYNCSNGVKIEGTIALHSEDIILDDKLPLSHEVVALLKNSAFENGVNNELLESFLDFETFEQICQTMSEILSAPIKSRAVALDILTEQLRYLSSFKVEGRYTHLFLLLEGEALYVNSVLISLLYNYGDEQAILPYFNEALAHWISFIKQMPTYYRQRWNLLSTYSMDFSKK